MSRNTSAVLAKFNLPLALLWLAGFIVTAVGYLVLTSSNAAQAEFYTSGSQDYATYFSAQSGSTLGSVLIGAGVLGLLLALAAHVKVRPADASTLVAEAEDRFDNELDLDDEDLDAIAPDAETVDDTVDSAEAAEENTDASAELDQAAAESELEPTTAR